MGDAFIDSMNPYTVFTLKNSKFVFIPGFRITTFICRSNAFISISMMKQTSNIFVDLYFRFTKLFTIYSTHLVLPFDLFFRDSPIPQI